MANIAVTGKDISTIEKNLRTLQLMIEGLSLHVSDEVGVALTHIVGNMAETIEPLIECYKSEVEACLPIGVSGKATSGIAE